MEEPKVEEIFKVLRELEYKIDQGIVNQHKLLAEKYSYIKKLENHETQKKVKEQKQPKNKKRKSTKILQSK